ncbi:hypothetical protein BS17DRAFT_714188 [Gyrodon lividus]|nr:hypothetical protein BS17DRAFT_714188 [Gyrodon lividus]
MTATYAFTDDCLQGQTIPHILVNIASPPSEALNLFNLYVTLSRSSSQNDKLQKLDMKMKRWWQHMGHDMRTVQD